VVVVTCTRKVSLVEVVVETCKLVEVVVEICNGKEEKVVVEISLEVVEEKSKGRLH